MPRLLITSPHNERIKSAVKLRDRKGRERTSRFLIEGELEIERALAAGTELEMIFVVAESEDEIQPRWQTWESRGAQLIAVTPAVMEKLAYGDRSESTLAVAKLFETSLAALTRRLSQQQREFPPLVLVLESIEKPGNLGAVLRSADAAGVSAVIVAEGGTDLFNPNVVRASRGALFSVPVATGSAEEILGWLREGEFRVYATRVGEGVLYTAASLTGPVAIALGSEANGLSAAWNAAEITPLQIPMLGSVDSLNVSITAAILAYEALRQRQANAG